MSFLDLFKRVGLTALAFLFAFGPVLVAGAPQVQSARNSRPSGTGFVGPCPPPCQFCSGAPGAAPTLPLGMCFPDETGIPGVPCDVTDVDCGGCDIVRESHYVTTGDALGQAVNTDQGARRVLCVPKFDPSKGQLQHVEVRTRVELTNESAPDNGLPMSCYGGPGYIVLFENLTEDAACEPFPGVENVAYNIFTDINVFDMPGFAGNQFLSAQEDRDIPFGCARVNQTVNLGDDNGANIVTGHVGKDPACPLPMGCTTAPVQCPPGCLDSYDGCTDGFGCSGTFSRLDPYSFCHVTCVDENSTRAMLPDFMAMMAGDVYPFYVDVTTVKAVMPIQGCADVLVEIHTEFRAQIEVTYTYCPNSPPECCPDMAGEVCPPSFCPGTACNEPDFSVCTDPYNILANDCDPDCDCAPGPDCVESDCHDDCYNGCANGTPEQRIDPTSVVLCLSNRSCDNFEMDPDCVSANGMCTPVILDVPGMGGQPIGRVTYYPCDIPASGIEAGDIVYCPAQGAEPGPVTIYYTVADEMGCYARECCPITFTVLEQPDAEDIDAKVCENYADATCDNFCTPITLTNNPTYTFEICDGPDKGTLIFPGDPGDPGLDPGQVYYCVDPNESGMDSFEYRLIDQNGCKSDCYTVTIDIIPIPRCVESPYDLGYICEDAPEMMFDLEVDVANGRTIDQDSIRFCTTGDCDQGCTVSPAMTAKGQVRVISVNQATETITIGYTPMGRGLDTFYMKFEDSNGCCSECCEIQIYLLGKPRPEPTCDFFDPEDPEDVCIDVVVFDQDGDHANCMPDQCPPGCMDLFNIMICTPPQAGQIIDIDQVNGKIIYRPDDPDNFTGDSFTFKVTDCFGCESDCVEAEIKPVLCISYNRRLPGSLLVYPEYDNRAGCRTVITLTNTRSFGGNVTVKFRYIDGDDCLHFGRENEFTPRDTLTICTSDHGPASGRGWMYAYAIDGSGQGDPIVWNFLVGQTVMTDGVNTVDYAHNAVSFRGLGDTGLPTETGDFTDKDMDGNRDLDDIEYEAAPDEILIPRFLGQDAEFFSDLILFSMSGGVAFTTRADFLIYNDNEQQFSAQETFYCWTKLPLLDISSIFDNQILQMFTDDDPMEIHDPDMDFDDTQRESGWIRIDGGFATSGIHDILDPVVYAVLVENRVFNPGQNPVVTSASDLPWEFCSQTNATLLPKGLWGDNGD